MEYDLKHWKTYPKVSCQCITYGRTDLLDEAVQSFLMQDYLGEKELVILNDFNKLSIKCGIPNIKIINLPNRVATIGDKRNLCVQECSGEIIFPWDDDDISLPHRISYSLQHMINLQYYKPDKFWYWNIGKLRPTPTTNIAHAMGAFSKMLWSSVGGYASMHSGQDQTIEVKFKKMGMHETNIPIQDIYYIVRGDGTNSYHLSSYGWGNGYDNVHNFVSKRNIGGLHIIKPHWKQDYIALIP